MKNLLIKIGAVVLAILWIGAFPASSQNLDKIKKDARTAAAGISVSTVNGKTTIVYQGREVWTGKTASKAIGRSKTVDGKVYAAAFDGTKVIWESAPGAAQKVK
jgi:hydrogenase maturation factor